MEYSFKRGEIRSYYLELQEKMIDQRDNRGKRHELSFVLVGFLCSVLCGCRTISSMVRYISKNHKWLVSQTGSSSTKNVSDAQFRRILEGLDMKLYNAINAQYFNYGLFMDSSKEEWYAIDGKELRGSIQEGEKRGESVVKVVSHTTKQSNIVGDYNANKTSEKAVVKRFVTENKGKIKLSFDALHTSQKILEKMEEQQQIYLAQVKKNQKYLLADVEELHQKNKDNSSLKPRKTTEKGHGRVEQRKVFFYEISIENLAERWKKTGIKTLIVIEKEVYQLKTKKITHTTSYHVSNMPLIEITKNNKKKDHSEELFGAVRGHWSVESQNFTQDTLMKEDAIKCSKEKRIKAVAGVLNVASNLLRKNDKKGNLTAFSENIADSKTMLKKCFVPK